MAAFQGLRLPCTKPSLAETADKADYEEADDTITSRDVSRFGISVLGGCGC